MIGSNMTGHIENFMPVTLLITLLIIVAALQDIPLSQRNQFLKQTTMPNPNLPSPIANPNRSEIS